jgi:hypothetical protein
MLAYTGDYSRIFHKADCAQLARVKNRSTIVVGEDPRYRPCLKCHPDAPRLKVRHPYCVVCHPKKNHPCAHNGGVKVWVFIRNYRREGFLKIPRWVWPEEAHRYRDQDLLTSA